MKQVGAVAVGVTAVLRLTRFRHCHQVVPEALAAQQAGNDAAAFGGIAGNRDGLTGTPQNDTRALTGVERAGGVGEGGEQRADAFRICIPAGPTGAPFVQPPRRERRSRIASELQGLLP